MKYLKSLTNLWNVLKNTKCVSIQLRFCLHMLYRTISFNFNHEKHKYHIENKFKLQNHQNVAKQMSLQCYSTLQIEKLPFPFHPILSLRDSYHLLLVKRLDFLLLRQSLPHIILKKLFILVQHKIQIQPEHILCFFHLCHCILFFIPFDYASIQCMFFYTSLFASLHFQEEDLLKVFFLCRIFHIKLWMSFPINF